MNIVAKINTDSLEDTDLLRADTFCVAAICYLCQKGNDGLILDSVTGLDEARSIDSVKEITLLVKPGDTARPVNNSFDRSAFAIVTNATAAGALSTANNALSSLTFHYQQTNTAK